MACFAPIARILMFSKKMLLNTGVSLASVTLPLIVFGVFDFFFSKSRPNWRPFDPPQLRSNGRDLYINYPGGYYALGPCYEGQDRYGPLLFPVKTDAHGYRVDEAAKSGPDSLRQNAKVIALLGDSFVYGVGLPWRQTFPGQLEHIGKLKVLNGGVNSHSPTPYLFRLRQLLAHPQELPPRSPIVVSLDISDVFDEATRWETLNGFPVSLGTKKIDKAYFDGSVKRDAVQSCSNGNPLVEMPKVSKKDADDESLLSPDNFKMTYKMYYGIESLVKRFIDDIQVRNNVRSTFTHRPWSEIDSRFSPAGVDGALAKIRLSLNEMSAISRDAGHPFYVLVYPWPAQLAYKKHFDWPAFIKEVCGKAKCTGGVIDATPDFEVFRDRNPGWQGQLYIKGDMHFNESGNKILAAKVANTILQH